MGQQGNILFGSMAPIGGGGIVVNGARDGLSVDSGGFIVLGEDVGAAGTPAVLLNDREIPMGNNMLNLFNGFTVISKAAHSAFGYLLEIYDLSGSASKSTVLIQQDSTGGGTATLLDLRAIVTGPVSIATPGIYLSADINAVNAFRMDYNGFTSWSNPNTGASYLSISDANELFGAAGGQAFLQIEGIYNTTIPVGTFVDIFLAPNFTTAAGAANVVQINMTPDIDQTGTASGSFTGILFAPGVTAINGQLIAYQNNIGDVLLQFNGGQGRTGIHGIPTPSAFLHLGGGEAAASSAPLKFATGILQTVPEQGAMEYNGNNLSFVRSGVTRETVLTGNTAAAPATIAFVLPTNMYGSGAAALTTPTTWVQVNIAGTNYKIPCY